VRRQAVRGQDGFADGKELRDRNGFDRSQSRVQVTSQDDRYYGDYDSGTDRSTYRLQDWADCAVEDSGSASEQQRFHGRNRFQSRNRFTGVATGRTCTAATE